MPSGQEMDQAYSTAPGADVPGQTNGPQTYEKCTEMHRLSGLTLSGLTTGKLHCPIHTNKLNDYMKTSQDSDYYQLKPNAPLTI